MFSITDQAASRIAFLVAQARKDSPDASVHPLRFRIHISGGGCSGFQYHFQLDPLQNSDDVIISHGEASVIIDSVSLSLIQEGVLEYKQEMVGSLFVIQNPQASSSCGCGQSFSL